MTARTEVLRPTRKAATATAAPDPVRRRRWVLTPYLFLLVPVVMLLVFTYLPVANMFSYSVTSWDGLSKTKHFVGLDNYKQVFTRPELFHVFWVSVFYLGGAAVQMVLALYFATVLSFKVRFKSLFKGILFFPYLINGVAIAFIFLYFFQEGGTLDSVLSLVGFHNPPQWLGNPAIANYSLAATSIWRYLGINFVLFLGAIQSIPHHLYEAAEIDGATRWQQFRYIIAPGIKPVISLLTILAVSGSLAVFEIPFIMTTGSNGTMTFVIQAYRMAFQIHKVGLASAMGVVLLFIILLVTWVQRRIVPDERVSLT